MSVAKQKKHPYTISKRMPTALNLKVSPVISELHQVAFVSCGNTILEYSLQTGILINTLRKNKIEQGNKDAHKSNIVALNLSNNSIQSICSKGVICEWDIKQQTLLNQCQLDNIQKIKTAIFSEDKIIIYSQISGLISIYDQFSKQLLYSVKQLDQKPSVKSLAFSQNTLVFSQGRHISIKNLKLNQEKVIQRGSTISTIAISHDASIIAAGDISGKMYIIHQSFGDQSQTVVQTLHWHSNAIQTLLFVPYTNFLLSAGEESVIVKWHLETQEKTFLSRVSSNTISQISLSSPNQTYLSILSKDNSYKVVRVDNNKQIVDVKNIAFCQNIEDNHLVQQSQNYLISSVHSELRFLDFNQQDQSVSSFNFKNRNFSKSQDSSLQAYAITPNSLTLFIYEIIEDSNNQNKDIKIETLRIFRRTHASSDLSDFQLDQLIQDPFPLKKQKCLIEAMDNSNVFVVYGSEVMHYQLQSDNKYQQVFSVSYQNLKVLQIETMVKLRIKNVKQNGQKMIGVLHEKGIVTFWKEEMEGYWVQIYTIKMESSDIVKIQFESSFRYMVALTSTGSCEIWHLHSKTHEKLLWHLNFTSITSIVNNPSKENQFFVLMNSDNDINSGMDTVLLFQYSRPYNMISYWKMQIPVQLIMFVNGQEPFLAVVNKRNEIQRIFCDVNTNDIRSNLKNKKMKLESKHKEESLIISSQKQADYQFINLKQDSTKSFSNQIKDQGIAIKRLDQSDRAMRDIDYSTIPSLEFSFQQMTNQLLMKKGSDNLIEMSIQNMGRRESLEIGKKELEGEMGINMNGMESEIEMMFEKIMKKKA